MAWNWQTGHGVNFRTARLPAPVLRGKGPHHRKREAAGSVAVPWSPAAKKDVTEGSSTCADANARRGSDVSKGTAAGRGATTKNFNWNTPKGNCRAKGAEANRPTARGALDGACSSIYPKQPARNYPRIENNRSLDR